MKPEELLMLMTPNQRAEVLGRKDINDKQMSKDEIDRRMKAKVATGKTPTEAGMELLRELGIFGDG